MMRHRDAWAEENRAPSQAEWQAQQTAEASSSTSTRSESSSAANKERRVVNTLASATAPSTTDSSTDQDVLVVVSKLKNFVRTRSGMNTSDGVVGVLSDHLRELCGEAIRNAARDGRRTVMERDFTPLVGRKP